MDGATSRTFGAWRKFIFKARKWRGRRGGRRAKKRALGKTGGTKEDGGRGAKDNTELVIKEKREDKKGKEVTDNER